MNALYDNEYRDESIRRLILSQARYMAWDDAQYHFENNCVWQAKTLQEVSHDYAQVKTWHSPLITPSSEQREAFRCEYVARYRFEVQQRRRRKAGNLVRVIDIARQIVANGGYIYTRKELYDELIADDQGQKCADYFAYGTPEYQRGDW